MKIAYFMNIQNVRKVVLNTSLLLCLFSCSSQPEIPSQQASLTSQQVTDLQNLKSHIEEWQEVKPSIKRLVAIESELNSLITELNNIVDSSSEKH